MKSLLIVVFVFIIGMLACKPKADKEKAETTTKTVVKTETTVEVVELAPETVYIDSLNTELEGSIKKLDELLNEIE